jgi:hypothetical protein
MGSVLGKESEPAKLWQLLEKAIVIAVEKRDAHRCMKCLRMSAYYVHWLSFEKLSRYPREEYFSFYEEDIYARRRISRKPVQDLLWARLATGVNAIVEEYKLEGVVPDSPEFLLKEKRFNASDYWRDWHRSQKK